MDDGEGPFEPVSLAPTVRCWLLDLTRGLHERDLPKLELACYKSQSFMLPMTFSSLRYIDLQSLPAPPPVPAVPAGGLDRLLYNHLFSHLNRLELAARPLSRQQGVSSYHAAVAPDDALLCCGFGPLEPLAAEDSLSTIEQELSEAFHRLLEDAYAQDDSVPALEEPALPAAEELWCLDKSVSAAEPVLPPASAQAVIPASAAATSQQGVEHMQEDLLPAVSASRSSLGDDDLLMMFMSTNQCQQQAGSVSDSTAARSSRALASARQSRKAPARKTAEKPTAPAAAPQAAAPKEVVPRTLLAADRVRVITGFTGRRKVKVDRIVISHVPPLHQLLDMNDDLVLELLDHRITLVDAPFSEVSATDDRSTPSPPPPRVSSHDQLSSSTC